MPAYWIYFSYVGIRLLKRYSVTGPLSVSGVVFIMLISVKMPTFVAFSFVGILTFMSRINSVLS